MLVDTKLQSMSPKTFLFATASERRRDAAFERLRGDRNTSAKQGAKIGAALASGAAGLAATRVIRPPGPSPLRKAAAIVGGAVALRPGAAAGALIGHGRDKARRSADIETIRRESDATKRRRIQMRVTQIRSRPSMSRHRRAALVLSPVASTGASFESKHDLRPAIIAGIGAAGVGGATAAYLRKRKFFEDLRPGAIAFGLADLLEGVNWGAVGKAAMKRMA